MSKSESSIVIRLNFIDERFPITHEYHVGPGDAFARLIDNLAADRAERLLFGASDIRRWRRCLGQTVLSPNLVPRLRLSLGWRTESKTADFYENQNSHGRD